ncbi:hypothetical protein A2697_00815 [Candidatus Curtissbacteria bacterium RIFCSPHIGHO2_01_FULL_41_44]|uniref:Methyltransferase type 12 domain-containing protein n=1 Tax=Candidatus Curtissbacteria bacterium RIFCSPLOWO2_01_FULL_42_50 TaxID=1797730 RepID=A0A1F5H770_9BACT|nr:MAG: hypothetical protein A3C33_02570 [Candidatus Curtissbacteria bacterium RIFCSPHIGHO2_02_FULL_42_58]OGD94198.1 MAG: hypothetical protein A2697_00815 [Candidatus Curtissbacteria bacterium RIFCSPHIGHO2_01_FULL_41_44]OGD97879.1 MAG: hypothetical protein A3E71_04900 [Candidatus Curtissbacteria bacterium RIFCSPHIGHO2_12_FULL_42_33]OGE00013.1 MAG: hypothetical protein A3B54_05145 [Candidatus Curtissbacteria bacterium RIFCSPLOWO2_01_FULL_42_50]OGE03310.1 MAG: hypothetical protein A3G16_00650 [Ca
MQNRQDNLQKEILESLTGAPLYNKWLLSKAKGFIKSKILEVGSGIGSFTPHLGELDSQVTPSEINKKFLKILNKKFENKALYLDITKVNFEKIKEKTFNTVVAINVLEHVLQDSLALENMAKLLKNDSNLILIVPAHKTLYGTYDKSLGHIRRYSAKELTEKVNKSGLKIRKIIYVNKIGAAAWFLNARILKLKDFPKSQIFFVNLITPLLDFLDKIIPLSFGLSIVCICRK